MNTYDDDRYDNAVNEVDRLRAELALQSEARMQAVRDMDEAETAISRVRELCDRVGNAVDEQSWPEIPNAAVKMIAAMVLRALAEGSE